jgi:hypothetical protein
METIINDFLEMEVGIKAIFCFWAFCVVSYYLTLVYGLGYSLVKKNKYNE